MKSNIQVDIHEVECSPKVFINRWGRATRILLQIQERCDREEAQLEAREACETATADEHHLVEE